MGNFCIKDTTFHNKLIQDFEPEFIDVFLSDKIDLDQEYISDEAYESLYNDLTNNYFMSTQFFDEVRQKLFEDAYIKDTLRLFVPESVADRIIQTGKNSKTYTDLLTTYNRILDLKTGYKDTDGNLVLGGGTLFLKNHKDIEDYVLRNKFNTFRKGSMEDFYDILGLNGTNYSFGNVVSDFSSSDVLNSFNRFFNQMVDESDVIEDKLSELSEATGIKVKVLDSENFYKELLDKIKDKNVYNLKNPTKLKQYLKNKKAFYYINDHGETFIYFNKDYLSYDTVSHEFMHFVVDVIEREDPKFLEELYNYINIKFEDKVKERINVYGEESIYTDESIKKEILVEILTDITNLNAVKSESPNIFNKIFTYIKRFILHILGLDYSEKRNLSLSLLLNDDLFLNNSINKINNILQKEGFITNLYRGLGSHVYFNTVINDHIVSLINALKYITPLINNLKKENTLSLILNINQLLKQSVFEQNAVRDKTIIKNSLSLLIDLHNILRTINNIYPAFSVANGIFRLFEINEDLIQRQFPEDLIQREFSEELYDEDKRIDKLFKIYDISTKDKDSDFYTLLHNLFLQRFKLSLNLVTKNNINNLKQIDFNDEFENLLYNHKLDYFTKVLDLIAYYDFVYKLYNIGGIDSKNTLEQFEKKIIQKLNEAFIKNSNEYLNQIIQEINVLERQLLNITNVDSNEYQDIQNKITKFTEIKIQIEEEIKSFKGLKNIEKIREHIRKLSNQSANYTNEITSIETSLNGIVDNLANSIYNYFYFVKSKNEDNDAEAIRKNMYNTFVNAMIGLFTGDKSPILYEMSNIINNTITSRKIYNYETNEQQKEALKKINNDWIINTIHETEEYLSVPFVLRAVYLRGIDNMLHELNNRIDGFYIGYLSQIFYSASYALKILEAIKDYNKEINNDRVDTNTYKDIINKLNDIVKEQHYHSYIYFLNVLKRFDLVSSQYSERTKIDSNNNIKILIIDLLCKFSETGRFDLKFLENNGEDLKSFLYYMILSLLYNHIIASNVLNVQNYSFEKYFKDFLNELTKRISEGKKGFIEKILKGDFGNLEGDLKVLKIEIDQAIKQANKLNKIEYNESLSFSAKFQSFKSMDKYHRIDTNLTSDYKGFFDFILQREGINYFVTLFREINNSYEINEFNNHLIDSLNSITSSIKEILDNLDDSELEQYLLKVKPFSSTLHEQYLINKAKKGVLGNFYDQVSYFFRGIELNPDAFYNAEAMNALNLSALAQNIATRIYSFIIKNYNGNYGENTNAKTVISSEHAVEIMNTLRLNNAEVFFSKLLTSESLSQSQNISKDIEINTIESFVRYIPLEYKDKKLKINVLSLKKNIYEYHKISYEFKNALDKFDNPYYFLSQMYRYEMIKGMNYFFNYFGKHMEIDRDPINKIRELFNNDFFNRKDIMNEEDFYVFFIKLIKLLEEKEKIKVFTANGNQEEIEVEVKEVVRKHLLNHFENYLNLRTLDSYIGDDFSEVAEKEVSVIDKIVTKLEDENIDIGELTFYLLAYFNEYIKENNPFKANFNIALNDPANTTINDLYVLSDDSSDAVLFKNAPRFMGFITSKSNKNKFSDMITEKVFEFNLDNQTQKKEIISPSIIAKVYGFDESQQNQQTQENQQTEQNQQAQQSGTNQNLTGQYESIYDKFLDVAENFAYNYSDIYKHSLDKNTKIVIQNIINNFVNNRNIYIPYFSINDKNYVPLIDDSYNTFFNLEKRLLSIFDFNKEAYVIESQGKISLRQKYYEENKDVINNFINNRLESFLTSLLTNNKYHNELLKRIKNKIKYIITDDFIKTTEGQNISRVEDRQQVVFKHKLDNVKMYDHLFHLRKLINENKDIEILKYLFFNSRDFNISLIELTKLEAKKSLDISSKEIKNLKILMLYMYLLGGNIKNYILNNIKKEDLILDQNRRYKIMKRFKETEEIYNVEFKEFNDNDDSIKEAAIQFLDGIMTYPVLSYGSVLSLIDNNFLEKFNTILNYARDYKKRIVYLEKNTDSGVQTDNYSQMKMDFIYFQKMISDLPGFIEEVFNQIKDSEDKIEIKTDDQRESNEIPVSDYFMTIIDAFTQYILTKEGKQINENNKDSVFNFQFLVISGNNLFNNTNSDVFYNFRNIIGSNSEHDMYNIFTFLFGQFSKSGVMSAFHNIFSYDQRTLTQARNGSGNKAGNKAYGGNSEKGKQFTIHVLHDLLNNMFGIKDKRYVDIDIYDNGVTKFMNYLTNLNEATKLKKYGLDDVHCYHIDDRLTVMTHEFLNKYLFTDKIITFKQKYDQFTNELLRQNQNQTEQSNTLSFFSFIPKLFKNNKCITENFDNICTSAVNLSFISSKSGNKGLQYLSRSFVNKDFRNFKKLLWEVISMSQIDDVVAYELYMMLESFHEGGYKGFINKISVEIEDKESSAPTGESQQQTSTQTNRVSYLERYLLFLKNLYQFLEQNKNVLKINHVVNEENSVDSFSDFDSNKFSRLNENKNVLYLLLYFNTISEKYYNVTYSATYIGEEGVEEREMRLTFRNEFVNFLQNKLKIQDNEIGQSDINRFFNLFLNNPDYKHITPDVNIGSNENDAKNSLYYNVKRFVENLKDIDDALTSSLYSQKLPEIAYYFNDGQAYNSITANAIGMYFDEIMIKSGNLIFNRDSFQNVFTENVSFDVAFSFVKSAKNESGEQQYENVLFKTLKNDFFVKVNNKNLFDTLNESDSTTQELNNMEDIYYKGFLDIYNDVLDRLYVNTTFSVLQSYEDYNLFIELSENQTQEYTVPLLPTIKDALIPKDPDTGKYNNNFKIINVKDKDESKSLSGKDVEKFTDIFDIIFLIKMITKSLTNKNSTNFSYTLLTTVFYHIFKFLRFLSKVWDKTKIKKLFNHYFVDKTDEPQTEEIQIATAREKDVEPEIIHKGELTENIGVIEKFLTGRINVFVLLYDDVVSFVQKNVIENLNTFIYKTQTKTVRPLMKRIRTFGDNLFNQLNKRNIKDHVRTLLNIAYIIFMYVIFLRTMDSFISVTIFLILNHLFILLNNVKKTGSVLRSFETTYRYVFSVVKSTLMLTGYTLLKGIMRSIPGFVFRNNNLKERFYNIMASFGLPRELGRLYLGEHGTTTSVRSFTLLQSLSELVSMTTFIFTNPIYVKNYLESLASGAASENAFSSIVISNKGDKVLFFGDIFEMYIRDKQAYIRLKPRYEQYLNVLNPDVIEIIKLIENSPKDKKGRNIGIPMLNLYNNKFLNSALITAADTMNVSNFYSALKAGIYDSNMIFINIIMPFASLITNSVSLFLRHIKDFILSKWFIAYIFGSYVLSVVNSLNPFYIETKLSEIFTNSSILADPVLSRILDMIPDTATDPLEILKSITGSPLNIMVGLLFGIFAYYLKGFFRAKHNPELRTKDCIYDAECTSFMLFVVIGLVLLGYNVFKVISNKEISEHEDNMALTYARQQQNLLRGEIPASLIPLELLNKKDKAGELLAYEMLTSVYDSNSKELDKDKIKKLVNYVTSLYDLIEKYNSEQAIFYKNQIDSVGSFFLPNKAQMFDYLKPETYATLSGYVPLNFRLGVGSMFYFEQLSKIHLGILEKAMQISTSDEIVNKTYDMWLSKKQSPYNALNDSLMNKKYEFFIDSVVNKIKAESESYVDENLYNIIPDFMNRRNYKTIVMNNYIDKIVSLVKAKASNYFTYGTSDTSNFKSLYVSELSSDSEINKYKDNINKYKNGLMLELEKRLPFVYNTQVNSDEIIKFVRNNYENIYNVLKNYETDIEELKEIQSLKEFDHEKAFKILMRILPEITKEDKFIKYYFNYKSPASIAELFDNFNKSLFSKFGYFDIILGVEEKTSVSPIIKEITIKDGNEQLSNLIDIYAQLQDTSIKESRVGLPMRFRDVVTKNDLYVNTLYNILFKNYIKATKNVSVQSDVGEIPMLVFNSRRGVFETFDIVKDIIKGFMKPRAEDKKDQQEVENQQQE